MLLCIYSEKLLLLSLSYQSTNYICVLTFLNATTYVSSHLCISTLRSCCYFPSPFFFLQVNDYRGGFEHIRAAAARSAPGSTRRY